ncbi:DNA-binding transcription factor [Lithospermum erythrorhizon]|uniref:DNA-binding transcription factor n=1 Tax=Lithospermum erythrorhizon TaxID=34254 RepID=A0AAV3Q9S6_LITER
MSHRVHRLLQIRRYVYHDVVRLEELEKLIDCSNVQAYTINNSKVIFIKKRPQNRPLKVSGNYCTSCDRCLQEPFLHCSLGCKVEFLLGKYNDLSPFLKKCKVLQLSSDFFIPQDYGDDDMTNETAHSTIIDYDEHLNSPSGSENLSFPSSELYVCGRSITKRNDEDMATNMSRRKGIPHRSPLC